MSPGDASGRFAAYVAMACGGPAVARRQRRQGVRRQRTGDAGGHQEQPELLTGRPDEQRYAGRGPLGDAGQRDAGDEVAVDDRHEGT